MTLPSGKSIVTIYQPSLPDGRVFSAEECCWGPAESLTYNTPMGGIASDLIRAGWGVIHSYSAASVYPSSDLILMPFVVQYERYLSDIARDLKRRYPKAKLIGIAVPQGLAGVSEYASCFDLLAGQKPVETTLEHIGAESSGYFPIVHPSSIPGIVGLHQWLLISTGCFDTCSYCTWGGRPAVWREPVNTVQSLEVLCEGLERGMTARAYLICAEMSLNRKWLREFAELKRSSTVAELRYVTDVRADQCTEEVVALLKESGCVEVTASVETPDVELLKRIGRHMSVERWVEGFRRLKAAGIEVQVPIMFNLDDNEDPETYARFVLENGISARPGIAKIYPGTSLWESTKEWDRIREWPDPTEFARTRRGVKEAIERLRRFEAMVEEGARTKKVE